ncbi:dihydrolipoyl dehydrogenase [Haloimpatiens sp. FM7315]|uniref:dihydrolipoyl dehydrogenase n=1 Tax=Haloimpatiens sp. FM7315 TaxID=3298609 RepID=UPI00370AD3BA
MDKDVIVIGGGPGGYVAAIRAAQLGLKVVVIEKDKFGGTCLNRGCIPTKALYREAEILNILKNIEDYGISVDSYKINVKKIQDRKNSIVSQLVSGIEQLMKANAVEVVYGRAELIDKNTVNVAIDNEEDRSFHGKNIIIATGSCPYIPDMPGKNLEGVITSDELLEFEEVPEELVVLGGGVIGMEFAGIFSAMGSKVTVIKASANMFPEEDSDIVKRFTASVKRKGIKLFASTKIKDIYRKENKIIIEIENSKGTSTVLADKILVSKGRRPVFSGLNLDRLGIKYNKKGIEVNENYETNIEGIYAIGDVNGITLLAHAASYQGVWVAEKIAGLETPKKASPVPNCIFVFPEIASIGLSEDKAKEKGIDYNVSKFMFGANGKALTLGETEGFVKIVSKASDNTILGVHIMGPHASDLIHEGALAVSNKLNLNHIKNTIHAHPTLAEAFSEAVLGLNCEAIHIANKKRNK